MTPATECTVFQGRAGDHNDLAMPGARAIGHSFARRFGRDPCVIGAPEPALNTPEASLSGYLGGLALAGPLGLWQSGLGAGLGIDRIVLVGQRDLDPFEQDLIDRHSIPHVRPGPGLLQDLRAAIAGRPAYVHLDCDVLNPGIVPTDYVLDGGLSLADLHDCCMVIAERRFIGIEIAEFQVSWTAGGDPVSPEPLLDALAPLLDAL